MRNDPSPLFEPMETQPGDPAQAAKLERLPPVRAEIARLQRITVCTRPFRAAGPRVETERIGARLVVHNYGHGGSGWSLSWGSAALVVPMALAAGEAPVAVLGCGALGLTAALALQRAGARVTIHARDLPPEVRSSRATGLWSPDSRAGLAAEMDSRAGARWERMARTSWAAFAAVTAIPNSPIDLHSRYLLSERPPEENIVERYREDPVGFAHLDARLADLYRKPVDRGPGEHPFRTAWCRELRIPRFNITAYAELLLGEFRQRGGTIQKTELHTPADLSGIEESVVVNCTGYGARALFGDRSLTPVRGQIGWLPAQPELAYSLQCGKLSAVPRRDGIAVQIGASSDGTGWDDPDEAPDRTEAEGAVRWLAELQAGVSAR